MSGFWRISVLIYVVTSASAQQNAGNLYCPMTWAEGQQVTLEFHIDESLFPSQCTGGTDNKPYFQRSLTSTGTPTILCRTADITTSNACTTSFSAGSLGCGCIVRNGSYVLQYNFVADTSHNGWWSADLQCADAFGQTLTFTATQCDNITVQEQSTTVPPSTSGEEHKDNGGLSSEQEIGIGVGVPVVIIVCGAIAAYGVIEATKMSLFLILTTTQFESLKQKIKDMKGVRIRPTTKEEKEMYKGATYVMELRRPFNQTKNKEKVDTLVILVEARYCHKDDPS